MDIFIASTSRWDDSHSSVSFSFAKEFAKNNRVFLIDHPFSWKEILSEFSYSQSIRSRLSALLFGRKIYNKLNDHKNLTIVTPRATFPINWMEEGGLYNALSKLNDIIVYKAVRQTIHDFNIKDFIFFNSYDPFFFNNFPDDIKPKIKIYQTIDDITQEAYIAKHGIRLEQEAFAKADVCLATSKELTRIVSNYSDTVFCMPNAADFSLFQKAVIEVLERPKEFVSISKKIICYTGNIGSRINYGLLKMLAITHVDKVIALVGPTSSNDYQKFGLDKLPNVIFAGPKNILELPAYLQYSDCLIIPFEYSKLTKSIYPLKINEYLTAGKPVVATSFSEDIIDFSDVAYIARTNQEFIDMIDQAIIENSQDKVQYRINKAATNTWENRVSVFWNIIESVCNK